MVAALEQSETVGQAKQGVPFYVLMKKSISIVAFLMMTACSTSDFDANAAKQFPHTVLRQSQDHWIVYTHEDLGFAIAHPSDMRIVWDKGSDAVRFQRQNHAGEWYNGWTIWRNSKEIEKYATTEGVVDHINPSKFKNTERIPIDRYTFRYKGTNIIKSTQYTPVVVGQVESQYVTVTVEGYAYTPYNIVFVDLDDYQYEISQMQCGWHGFEKFYQSFVLL